MRRNASASFLEKRESLRSLLHQLLEQCGLSDDLKVRASLAVLLFTRRIFPLENSREWQLITVAGNGRCCGCTRVHIAAVYVSFRSLNR
jgi:hypothetical protein